MPLPPGMTTTKKTEESEGKLTENEASFILDSSLKSKHRNDPIVIAFIQNFIRCRNIAEASAETGINARLGYEIRHRTDVISAIQRITDKSVLKHGFDAGEVIQRTKEVMDFDPIEMQRPDGSFKSNLYEVDPAARRNLKKLKVKNLYDTKKDINGMDQKIIVGEVIEYEFYDKMKAVELLGKEKDLFKTTTRVEHDVTKDMKSVLLASSKRGESASLAYSTPRTVEVESSVVEESDDDT